MLLVLEYNLFSYAWIIRKGGGLTLDRTSCSFDSKMSQTVDVLKLEAAGFRIQCSLEILILISSEMYRHEGKLMIMSEIEQMGWWFEGSC